MKAMFGSLLIYTGSEVVEDSISIFSSSISTWYTSTKTKINKNGHRKGKEIHLPSWTRWGRRKHALLSQCLTMVVVQSSNNPCSFQLFTWKIRTNMFTHFDLTCFFSNLPLKDVSHRIGSSGYSCFLMDPGISHGEGWGQNSRYTQQNYGLLTILVKL